MSKRGDWPPILLSRGRMKDARLDLDKWYLAHFRMAAQVEVPSKNYPCFWFFSIASSSLIRIHRSLRPPARMILAKTRSQKKKKERKLNIMNNIDVFLLKNDFRIS